MLAFTVGKSNKKRGIRTNIMEFFPLHSEFLLTMQRQRLFLRYKTNLKLVKNKKNGHPTGCPCYRINIKKLLIGTNLI